MAEPAARAGDRLVAGCAALSRRTSQARANCGASCAGEAVVSCLSGPRLGRECGRYRYHCPFLYRY
ncbi:hypothetical protein [Lysobacter gummosus]|uniref:hypothetical protein n=1 Tax=Lysobacter gummosus TaxID=262324 RepID=UPI003641E23F